MNSDSVPVRLSDGMVEISSEDFRKLLAERDELKSDLARRLAQVEELISKNTSLLMRNKDLEDGLK